MLCGSMRMLMNWSIERNHIVAGLYLMVIHVRCFLTSWMLGERGMSPWQR